jgi:uncharacterized protein DUF4372
MTRVCSIFSQILQLIPRPEFESAVRQHKAERHVSPCQHYLILRFGTPKRRFSAF